MDALSIGKTVVMNGIRVGSCEIPLLLKGGEVHDFLDTYIGSKEIRKNTLLLKIIFVIKWSVRWDTEYVLISCFQK